jgi:hypothetical protein
VFLPPAAGASSIGREFLFARRTGYQE